MAALNSARIAVPSRQMDSLLPPGWWLLPSIIGGGYIWVRILGSLLG